MPLVTAPDLNQDEREREIFTPTERERDFLTDVYARFWDCYTVQQDTFDILNGRTISDFRSDCRRDYTVTLNELEDDNDPVKQYQSTISRDKANVYISHISGALLYPDVIAQNNEQGIDRVWGRVGSSMLYWAHRNDGWPNENGQQKAERVAHETVVTGTGFTLDIVTKEGLESENISPEELYFTTFWQPNLQKHPVIFRAKLNITYEEADQMFGDCDNFGSVTEGSEWMDGTLGVGNELKTSYEGIVQEDKVSVLYVWKQATPSELKKLKKKGKCKKDAERACYYNVIINGVPMFPVDNLLAYNHGYYPISKCIFEILHPDFLFGNSAPNKMREDKKWKDNWKTLMRYKGKLSALPPQLIIGGHLDEQIILPGAQTSVPEGIEVKAVEGVSNGITNSDIQLMQMVDSDIDSSSVSPSSAGQRPGEKQTARAEVIQAAAAQRMLEPFSRQYAYYMQSRSFHILMSLLQLMPKKSIKKIAVPDQILSDGLKGTFEIMFENVKDLGEFERLQKSLEIGQEEKVSRERNEPREVVYVSPSQIREMKFYLFSDATAGLQDKSFVLQAEYFDFLKEIGLARPDLIDQQEAIREYVRMKGFNERILAKGNAAQPAMAGGGGVPTGSTGAPSGTDGDMVASAASGASTGQSLPSLPRI